MKMDIYEQLNIKRNAPKEEIKKQYKEFCKKNHPDVGGDTKDFQEKQQYYAIVLDDQKRKRYDETGETETVDKRSKITTMAIGLFEALMQRNPDNLDESIKDLKAHTIGQVNQTISNYENEKKRITIFMERVKLKDGKDNPILFHIERKIDNLSASIELAINQKKDYNEAFNYIENSFSFDNKEEVNVIFPPGTKFEFTIDGKPFKGFHQ